MPSELSDKVHILLYADDSKLISALNDSIDAHLTQSELDKLVNWTNTWLMESNLDKWKVMHFGTRSDLPRFDYTKLHLLGHHLDTWSLLDKQNLKIDFLILVNKSIFVRTYVFYLFLCFDIWLHVYSIHSLNFFLFLLFFVINLVVMLNILLNRTWVLASGILNPILNHY